MHQYPLTTSYHTKRSIPHSQALCILIICSNIETVRLRRTEIEDSLVERDYYKRKTNKQKERAFTNFANPQTGRENHATQPVHISVQFHPGLPGIDFDTN